MVAVVVVVGTIMMEECDSGKGTPRRESSPSSARTSPLESTTSTWIFVSKFGCEGEDGG